MSKAKNIFIEKDIWKTVKIEDTEYLIEKHQLGSGSFGVVRKAYMRIPGTNEYKTFAVKIFDLKEKHNLKIIQNEVTKFKDLDHKNIVKYHTHGKTKNSLYIVMEYCKDGDIASFCDTKGAPLAISKVWNIMDKILQAMEYLEKKKIYHRDLKPKNILRHDDIIKICDFGFSKMVDKDEPVVHSKLGTEEYMAYELLTGQEYDSKVDVYSCGIIFYELIYGVHPYFSRTENKTGTTLGKLKRLKDGPWDPMFKEISSHENRSESLANKNFDKYIRLIKGMIQIDPIYRYSWKDVFNDFKWIEEPSPFNELTDDSYISNISSSTIMINSVKQNNKILKTFNQVSNKKNDLIIWEIDNSLLHIPDSNNNPFSKLYRSKMELAYIQLINFLKWEDYEDGDFPEAIQRTDILGLKNLFTNLLKTFCKTVIAELTLNDPQRFPSDKFKDIENNKKDFLKSKAQPKILSIFNDCLLPKINELKEEEIEIKDALFDVILTEISSAISNILEKIKLDKLKPKQKEFLINLVESEVYWKMPIPEKYPFPNVPDFESIFVKSHLEGSGFENIIIKRANELPKPKCRF